MRDGHVVARRSRWRPVVVGATYAGIVTLLFHLFARDFPISLRFEHQFADWRTGVLSDRGPTQHPRIAVVLVDDEVLKGLPYTSPVDRGFLARLVERLDAAGAQAIALDFVFQRPTEPAKDKALIAAIRAAKAPVILAAGDERTRGLTEEELGYQRDFIAETGRRAGYANLDEDGDDVVRHRIGPNPGGGYPVSFAARIAEIDGKTDADPGGRMAWLRRPANNTDTFFKVRATLVFDDGAVGAAVRERIKGRLVLVGGAFPDRDRHRTPLFASDGEGGTSDIHGVILQAHALAQILDGRYVLEIDDWPVVLLVSMAGLILGAHFNHRGFSWISGTVSTGLLVGFDLLLFWRLRWIVPYFAAVTAWLVGGFGGYLAARLSQLLAARREARDKMGRSILLIVGLSAWAAGMILAGPAVADVLILDSNVPEFKRGTQLPDRARLQVPAGKSVMIMRPSGETEEVVGPYDRLVRDVSRGEMIGETFRRMKRQLGGSIGATRGLPK